MIRDIENWLPWEQVKGETMEYRVYKGTDPRLAYDRKYGLTVARKSNVKNGPVDISVHIDLKGRIYKHYDTEGKFNKEWVKEERL